MFQKTPVTLHRCKRAVYLSSLLCLGSRTFDFMLLANYA